MKSHLKNPISACHDEKCLVSFHPGNFEPATDGKWVDDPMTGDSTDRKVENWKYLMLFNACGILFSGWLDGRDGYTMYAEPLF